MEAHCNLTGVPPGSTIHSVRLLVMAVAVIVAVARGPLQAQPSAPPALDATLARAADAVDAYARLLTGVVLQETYVQDVRFQAAPQPGFRRVPTTGPGHRQLKSDLLLIRRENSDGWRQFRDVYEVDGKSVRDRNDRLARLFLKPSASAETQAGQLAAESARYNIGDITRDINLPLLTLLVLDRANQPRFKFSERPATDTRGLPRSPSFALPAGTRAVQYEEVQPHTLVRTTGDRDLPIRGRLWIEPESGRVLLTELIVADRIVDARIHVVYQDDPGLNLLVPIEMHELYERLSDHMRIEGTATYSNFRRFQVQVDESLSPIK
jgi:hypothetical protein